MIHSGACRHCIEASRCRLEPSLPWRLPHLIASPRRELHEQNEARAASAAQLLASLVKAGAVAHVPLQVRASRATGVGVFVTASVARLRPPATVTRSPACRAPRSPPPPPTHTHERPRARGHARDHPRRWPWVFSALLVFSIFSAEKTNGQRLLPMAGMSNLAAIRSTENHRPKTS